MTEPVHSVLVVDDQPEVRQVLRRVLERARVFGVAEAANVPEAITLVRAAAPDLVLLDISMPGTSGIAAIRQIVEIAPRTRIVVLSSHGGMNDEVMAMGAHAFYPKTTPPKKLVKALERLLAS